MGVVATYAVWLPLSYLLPALSQFWLLDNTFVLYAASSPYPFLPNVLMFAGAVILTPWAEEWFFRGLLLRRWTDKWGTGRGVVASSAVFAVFHADFLGAFIFAIVMCALYARYQSLWAPTMAHAANNGLAWLLTVIDAHSTAISFEAATLDEFRSDWLTPAVGVLLVAPWIRRARDAWASMPTWQFGVPPTTTTTRPVAEPRVENGSSCRPTGAHGGGFHGK